MFDVPDMLLVTMLSSAECRVMASEMAALAKRCHNQQMRDEYLEMSCKWRSLATEAAKYDAHPPLMSTPSTE